MRNIYTSIDIGSDAIKVIVCELFNNKVNLLASSSIKSKGIKKGIVTDVEEASISLKEAINEVETKLGIQIKEVLTTIPSYNSSFSLINGSIAITNPDGVVTGEDIISVLQQGMRIEEVNMEMVTIIPIRFIIDGRELTNAPIGKKASRLESKSILVTAPNKNIYDALKIFDKCHLEVLDISISGICDMYALRSSELKDKVGVIVNYGSEITSISLYNKGIIIDNKVIPTGSRMVDNDLAYVYKTSMIEAKKLKEKFAVAIPKYASVNDIYDLLAEDGKIVKVNQKEVSTVVATRLDETLRGIKQEIRNMTVKDLDYIIFTGGGTNMSYMEYMIEDIFGPIAKIGKVNIVGLRNSKYSTGLGSIVYYINKQMLKGELTSMIEDHTIDSLSSLKKNMLNVSNSSMLGKVAEYFFGE